jgi:hypothetical protein
MNHIAFDVPAEKIDEYRERLTAKGIANTLINHDRSPRQRSESVNESTIVRSIYFMDPDGIVLEFAAWLRPREELFKESPPPNLMVNRGQDAEADANTSS